MMKVVSSFFVYFAYLLWFNILFLLERSRSLFYEEL